MSRINPRPTVVKFGGAALADVAAVAERVRNLRAHGTPLVVVVSAREGTTDRLLEASASTTTGSAVERTLRWVRGRHPGAGVAGERHLAELERALRTHASGALGRTDRILAMGERLAVDWLVPALRERGLDCVGVDAARLGLWTDGRHGGATVDLERSKRPVREGLRPLLARGTIPVVTGFFGRGERGEPVTLGRGGSDYSASAIAALLGASVVELVKREASILSADPAVVPGARPIRSLTYAEAEELAEFGARVLHPMTVEPARRHSVEIRVRSMVRPDELTVVGPASEEGVGVRALTISPVVHLFRLRFPGGRRRPGVLAELCARLAEAGVPVLQAFTSAAVVSVVVESGRSPIAARVLASLVEARAAHLEPATPVVLIAAVGSGALREIGRFPPGILATARGVSATRASITIAVPAAEGTRSLRELHAVLVEQKRPLARTGPAPRRPFAPRPARSTRPNPAVRRRSGGKAPA
jgi:bifunctional aspartokinase / homoserine dehydrogenase 1